MQTFRNNFYLLLVPILLFSSCGKNKPQSTNNASVDTLKLNYAQGFSIHKYKSYREVTVFSPWKKGKVYAKYYLVHKPDVKTPTDGIRITVPIKKLACSSVTHLSFIDALGKLQTVKGFCKNSLVYNPAFREMAEKGEVTDLGEEFTMNAEKVLGLKPDILMISGYNQTDANVQRIQQAGVPVIFNMEWMETSLLGRAEWIKFVAAFYDKEKKADNIFADVEKKYNDLKNEASQTFYRPKILSGSNFRGTWYMPSGRSFMGELYRDAGADYFYANDTTGGSLPLNIETVLNNFHNVQVWLNCNYKSIHDLTSADEKNKLFGVVKKGEVYNFNKRMLPSTANDFWESAVVHPDWLLADVIGVLHPEILPNYELIYTEQLTPDPSIFQHDEMYRMPSR